MNLLIDSNVILDMVQRREPFCANSKEIIARCIKPRTSRFCFGSFTLRYLLYPSKRFIHTTKIKTGRDVLPVLYCDSRKIQ